MAKSSADYANWRERPEVWEKYMAQVGTPMNEGGPSLWNFLRNRSWQGMGTVNRMPHVFDPSSYPAMNSADPNPVTAVQNQATPQTIANAIKPGSAPQQPSLPEEQQGILQMLIQQQSPALMALLGKPPSG